MTSGSAPNNDLRAQLEATRAELAQCQEELRGLLYAVSHDLREPARMVASYTELLREHVPMDDEEGQLFMGFAIDGAERLKGYLSDLVSLSRLESRPAIIERFNLLSAVETATYAFDHTAEEAGATFALPESMPDVEADRARIVLVFEQLFSNALKFRTTAPPLIEVTWEDSEHHYNVHVKDNGIGVDARNSERIFAAFQRLHTRDEFEGAGMGLAIVKKTVRKSGGQVWVQSQLEKGSTFSFSLPKPPQRET